MANFRKIPFTGTIVMDVDSFLVDLFAMANGLEGRDREIILDLIEQIMAARRRAERKL